MKLRLFLISLIATLIFSQPLLRAEDNGVEVIYPFIEAESQTLVLSPYLQESFLEYLKSNSVFPVIDSDGFPLFYYSDNETFGCYGVCSNITMNNYSFGSKLVNITGFPVPEILPESVIVGSPAIESSMNTMNSIRASLAENPAALAEFERQLLEEQEGYLRSVYFANAYGDVWDYALDEIKHDPEIYNSILKNMHLGNLEGSIDGLEKHLLENFDINEAYDLSNLYSAIENKKIGQAQIEEFMRNVLKRMSEEENIDLNLEDLDKLSDMLNSDEFKRAMDKAMEMIEENPEAFEKLQDLANEMLARPETQEVFKQALKELMERGDWDSVKKLLDVFNKMDNKQQLMETMMEGFSDHMRDMVTEGKLDEIKELISDEKLRKMMLESAQSFSKGIFENLADWAKETPVELAYIVALAAVIAALILFMKMKI